MKSYTTTVHLSNLLKIEHEEILAWVEGESLQLNHPCYRDLFTKRVTRATPSIEYHYELTEMGVLQISHRFDPQTRAFIIKGIF